MKVSASLLKTWMKCSQMARYKYIEELPDKYNAAAAFGSAVHLSLELYNTHKDIDLAKTQFLEIWDNPEEFDIKIEVWPPRTSFGAYRERGIDFIERYHENTKWISKKIIASEHRFCVPIGDHHLSGIVDLLEVPDGFNKLKVVDFKTGYRPNSQGLNHDVQFTAYLYAAQHKDFWCGSDLDREKYPGFDNGEELYDRFKNFEISGIWYDLRNSKEYEVGPRSQSDYDKLLMCIEQVARAIELQVFVPDISGDSCGLCSYRDICPLFSSRTEVTLQED